MISIGVPVLNRPGNAGKVYETIVRSAAVPYEVVWVCSPNDHAQIAACQSTGCATIVVGWQPGPGDFARKHNLAFQETTGDWYMAAADDLQFMKNWDIEALRIAETTGAKVIGTNDLANPQVKRGVHATHMLFDRDYVEHVGATWHDGPGVVYCEQYDHQWVDNEAVAVAKTRGVWAFAAEAHVQHHHPLYNKQTRMDSTYTKAMAKGKDDYMLFNTRKRKARAT